MFSVMRLGMFSKAVFSYVSSPVFLALSGF